MSRISTSWRRCWLIAQATLWATVEPPEPPLAETNADGAADRRGAFGGEEIGDGGDDRLGAVVGRTMYSETPERISSR